MYIEETGAGDGDIKVSVEGEEYTAEANYDLDGDGVDETVSVMTDGGSIAYVDENGDGFADITRTMDHHGTVVSQARFDPATGGWIDEPPQQTPPPQGPPPAGPGPMVLDTPHGDQQVGPPTEDTNNDGKLDTAIVETGNGTMMVTDVDGDGSADQMVEVNTTGEVTVSHHTGENQWAVVQEGRIDQGGQYVPNPAAPAVGTDDVTWSLDERSPGDDGAVHNPTPNPPGDLQAAANQSEHSQPAGQPNPQGPPPGFQPADSDAVWA